MKPANTFAVRKLAALMFAALILATVLPAGCASEDLEEASGFDGPAVYVDAAKGSATASGSHGAPVSTIAAAVALAKAGDTIVIAAGTYAESVDLPVDVGLKGAGSGKTIIAPPAGARGIYIAPGGGVVRVEGVAISKATGYGLSADSQELALADVKVNQTGVKPGAPGSGHGVQFVNGAKLIMENCNITGNAGVGVVAVKVASVAIVDPAYSVSPRGDGGGRAIVDPAYSPASNISGNHAGGIAIVDPAYSPGGGKADDTTEHFQIRSTAIKDNTVFGLAIYGGNGSLDRAVITGTKKSNDGSDFADGLVISDSTQLDLLPGASVAVGHIRVGADAIVGGNQRTGLLVSASSQVTVDGEIRANVHGGVWARGESALVKLTDKSRLCENEMVGVAVTFGARLEATGARIESTKLRPFTNLGGGMPVDIGDGVGIFDNSRAVISGATLEGNGRAGVVAHGVAANDAGQVDIAVTGTKFIGGEFGIVVNKQAAGAAPASVPAAQLALDNTFDGQKTKIDPAGELSVKVSPCGTGAQAEAKCAPSATASE